MEHKNIDFNIHGGISFENSIIITLRTINQQNLYIKCFH